VHKNLFGTCRYWQQHSYAAVACIWILLRFFCPAKALNGHTQYNLCCMLCQQQLASCMMCEQSNVGLILHAVGEFEVSLRFLQKAMELSGRLAWKCSCFVSFPFFFPFFVILTRCLGLAAKELFSLDCTGRYIESDCSCCCPDYLSPFVLHLSSL